MHQLIDLQFYLAAVFPLTGPAGDICFTFSKYQVVFEGDFYGLGCILPT